MQWNITHDTSLATYNPLENLCGPASGIKAHEQLPNPHQNIDSITISVYMVSYTDNKTQGFSLKSAAMGEIFYHQAIISQSCDVGPPRHGRSENGRAP